MTIAELIAELEMYDPDCVVKVWSDVDHYFEELDFTHLHGDAKVLNIG